MLAVLGLRQGKMGKEQSLQEAHLQGAEESMSTGMFPKGQECVNYL